MLPQTDILPLLLYTAATVLIIGVLLIIAWWLGARTTSFNKEMPYESGIIPASAARRPLSVPFYLCAIFFIVFDVETAFIFTWASVWDDLGFPGLLHISFFIVALLLGLAWLWFKGGLEWGPTAGKTGLRGRR